jgi:hypothetical protein
MRDITTSLKTDLSSWDILYNTISIFVVKKRATNYMRIKVTTAVETRHPTFSTEHLFTPLTS